MGARALVASTAYGPAAVHRYWEFLFHELTTLHENRRASAAERTAAMTSTAKNGATVWLTGLPSAGKTTIAGHLAERLRAAGRRVEVLDGDEIRRFLSAGLGFSREDRNTNVQRIGLVAEVLARNGVIALVPVIAPYADSREAVRKRHEASGTPYAEIHVATPVEVCSRRDVKGLYARQAAGRLTGLTGVDDPYEAPDAPELVLRTEDQTPEQSADAVHALLAERGLV
ncbi:adenylyl-sulfate kinase [Streptomyces sp. GC420]|uniref:adenylyl-sulfate kinase n=1 Tax=Streptomyces sp. GC420 TaxID=2697568 RepID=UPI0037DA069A